MLNDTRSDEYEGRLHQFADLVNATATVESRRDLFNLRIESKIAHAGLLTKATFSTDYQQAAWAADRAATAINFCADFLLDS